MACTAQTLQRRFFMLTRRYAFSWDFVGNVHDGRPNLGNNARIEVYRLFQYTMRDIVEARYGTAASEEIMRESGKLAGRKFCERFVGRRERFDDFVAAVQKALLDFGIGILRVESANYETSHFTLTVAEDLDCSGLPDMEHTVCHYDEGFLAGVLFAQTGTEFDVREVDCWCTGDRTCRFEVKPSVKGLNGNS